MQEVVIKCILCFTFFSTGTTQAAINSKCNSTAGRGDHKQKPKTNNLGSNISKLRQFWTCHYWLKFETGRFSLVLNENNPGLNLKS